MTRYSKPLSDIADRYDAIVVGSGYGGGVAASRLARMGLKTALLERGQERHPGEYPDTPQKALAATQVTAPDLRAGDGDELFDLRVGKDLNVLVGCGLGGTSLINANVSIEPDSRVLEASSWPQALKDQHLAEGFARARAMLRPTPYPEGSKDWPSLNKTAALKKSAEALKTELKLPDINVAFAEGHNAAGVWQNACNLCGDCCSGCNIGAKTTVLMTYVPDAAAFGAEIFCGAAVHHLEKLEGGGWCVHIDPVGFERSRFEDSGRLTIRARIIVLAAGALGSTEILLRSAAAGLSLSPALGTRFSGNGDVLAFGYNNDVAVDGIGMGWDAAAYDWRASSKRPVGPTITGLIDLRDDLPVEEGMIVEEGSIPGGLGKFLPAMMAMASKMHGTDTDKGDLLSERAREIESITRGPYHGAVNHTQTYLVMSHDGADGSLILEEDRVRVQWPGVGARPGFMRVAQTIAKAVAPTGGTYVPNPIWTKLLRHQLVTVHPLGGCPIGADAASGVVDSDCRVFEGGAGTAVHEGLLVCDGAVMPSSLGVNPLLTITAVAERAMIRLAEEEGRIIDMQAARPQPRIPLEADPIGIRFTEKMEGRLVRLEDRSKCTASFVATVIADDLDALIADKDREADLAGTVSIPFLADEPLTIHGGKWNLFIDDPAQPETKRMLYFMPFTTKGGNGYLASGSKEIHDDQGVDLWQDTTSLAIEVREGADGSGPVVFSGNFTIDPKDFVRQLQTMTVTGAPDFQSGMRAMARFGTFFAGELFQSFGGPFATPLFFDPAAIRVRRPLRTATPEIHHVTTEDGKHLRLTRYKGGDKGPVLLSHGLGVSSLIFTIDTIDTSLLEYLYAGGFDCWLLDYRASIALPYATEQFTADDVAAYDYPAAINHVRFQTKAEDVQVVAHCYGAMSFAMAMLRGLEGVRSAVISQIAAHADVPWWTQRLLAFARAPDLMGLAGARFLDACATKDRNRLSRAIDWVLAFYPYRSEDRTRSATSRRITALYGPLYRIDQLNQATLDALPEMFGKANIAAFKQLSKIARAGKVVPAGRGDAYLTNENLKNFAVPTLFVHGELNGTFLPSGTLKTMRALARANGPDLYERYIVPGTGHIDCIFGRDAPHNVFPRILEHLERNAHG